MEKKYVVVMDNDLQQHSALIACLAETMEDSAWNGFALKTIRKTEDAEQFAAEHDAPVIFIADMEEMAAISMIRRIREVKPRTNFIVVADKREYIVHALRMNLRLSGYILEQPSCENIKDQLDNLWYPIDTRSAS